MKKLFALAAVAVVSALIFVAWGVPRGQKSRQAKTAMETEATATHGVGAGRTPVVVELFTSEGCSSCPPADALLSRFEKTQPVAGVEIIPLAMHVDYWNYLGWADPFASAVFSARQGEYADAYGKDGVYTPQMIVDGVEEFPGGKSNAALAAVTEAARRPKAEVKITRAGAPAEDTLRLTLHVEQMPKPNEGDAAYVLLAVTESDLSNDVRRGENAGKRLGHAGVVRRLTTVGPVPAAGGAYEAEAVVTLEKGWRRENLRAAVFAQESRSRRVLAAGSLKLSE